MKNIIFGLLVLVSVTTFGQVSNPIAQQSVSENSKYILPIDKVAIKGSYPLGISDIKTIHIVFPAEIKEVDAGTSDVLVEITPSFNNVLKVKSTVDSVFKETNLTILTADGGLYSFVLNYQKEPEVLNINIGNNLSSDVKNSSMLGINHFLKSNYIDSEFNESNEVIKTNLRIANNSKAFIKNIGVKNGFVSAFVKGIYTYNSMMYISFDIINETNIDYSIDFMKLYVKDKEDLKRMTVQEEELRILDTFSNNTLIIADDTSRFTIATPLFSLSDEKIVELEIYEKNGGRHLRFPIPSKIIAKAKKL